MNQFLINAQKLALIFETGGAIAPAAPSPPPPLPARTPMGSGADNPLYPLNQ